MAVKEDSNRARMGVGSFYDFDKVNEQADNSQAQGRAGSDGVTGGQAESVTSGGTAGQAEDAGAQDRAAGIARQPYSGFTGSNYAELEDYIKGQMRDYKPETEEERKKRERYETRAKRLAAIADVLGTMHKTYAYQRGVQPMEVPGMTEKAQARFDKAKAERDRDRDRYLNYAIALGNLRDKDRDFRFSLEQARNQQNNWQVMHDDSRQDRKEDVDYRNGRANVDDTHWDKTFDYQKERDKVGDDRWDKNFRFQQQAHRDEVGLQWAAQAENARHNREGEGLQQRQLALSQDGKYTEFYTGSGMIKLPNSRLNEHNIGYVFSKTPTEGRPSGGYNMSTGQKTPVSPEEMMNWIGAHIDDKNVQKALRAIGGKEKRGRGY